MDENSSKKTTGKKTSLISGEKVARGPHQMISRQIKDRGWKGSQISLLLEEVSLKTDQNPQFWTAEMKSVGQNWNTKKNGRWPTSDDQKNLKICPRIPGWVVDQDGRVWWYCSVDQRWAPDDLLQVADVNGSQNLNLSSDFSAESNKRPQGSESTVDQDRMMSVMN